MGGYTARLYGRLNKSLRSGQVPQRTTLIDQYLEVAPKFTGNKLYRGIGKELFQTILSTKSKTLIDKAFMSVTADYTTAKYYAKRSGKGGVLTLTGALYKAAQAPLPMAFSETEGEMEFIFPRNIRMKIISIDGDEIQVKVL